MGLLKYDWCNLELVIFTHLRFALLVFSSLQNGFTSSFFSYRSALSRRPIDAPFALSPQADALSSLCHIFRFSLCPTAFLGPLPASYLEWKRRLVSALPLVFDTKHIAEHKFFQVGWLVGLTLAFLL